MSCGDPPQCTCPNRFGDLTYTPMPSYCPVHNPHTPGTWGGLSATKVEVEAPAGKPIVIVTIDGIRFVTAPAGKPIVIVTIDGIRFVTDCADNAQAIALAERVARALGIRWSPL